MFATMFENEFGRPSSVFLLKTLLTFINVQCKIIYNLKLSEAIYNNVF